MSAISSSGRSSWVPASVHCRPTSKPSSSSWASAASEAAWSTCTTASEPPASKPRSTMSTSPQDFNARIIDEFRANEGRVGGPFEGSTLLLLHHIGAKSGKDRINPLVYNRDGDRYVVFASKAGAPTNPDWYHNVKAHPDVTIEVGTDTIDVRAEEATGEE